MIRSNLAGGLFALAAVIPLSVDRGVCTVAIVHGQEKPKPIAFYNAVWSPDGKSLAFESNRDGKFGIYVIGLDSTGLRRLSKAGDDDTQPNWSPDGKRLVFSSDRDGNGDLYLMNADGSNQVQLTKTTVGSYYQSAFSPDGRWIAFQGRSDNKLFAEHIYVIRADGTGWRELTDSTTSSMGPAWSRDGQWIHFTQHPALSKTWDETTAVLMAQMRKAEAQYAIRPDGTGLKKLPHREELEWTADGKTAYYVSGPESARVVYAMDADGSHVRRIGDRAVVGSANISPDGRFIASEKNTSTDSGVYVYEIATGKSRKLTGWPAR